VLSAPEKSGRSICPNSRTVEMPTVALRGATWSIFTPPAHSLVIMMFQCANRAP
jgi:hypothetical protein